MDSADEKCKDLLSWLKTEDSLSYDTLTFIKTKTVFVNSRDLCSAIKTPHVCVLVQGTNVPPAEWLQGQTEGHGRGRALLGSGGSSWKPYLSVPGDRKLPSTKHDTQPCTDVKACNTRKRRAWGKKNKRVETNETKPGKHSATHR